jgi:hypothetical protein
VVRKRRVRGGFLTVLVLVPSMPVGRWLLLSLPELPSCILLTPSAAASAAAVADSAPGPDSGLSPFTWLPLVRLPSEYDSRPPGPVARGDGPRPVCVSGALMGRARLPALPAADRGMGAEVTPPVPTDTPSAPDPAVPSSPSSDHSRLCIMRTLHPAIAYPVSQSSVSMMRTELCPGTG